MIFILKVKELPTLLTLHSEILVEMDRALLLEHWPSVCNLRTAETKLGQIRNKRIYFWLMFKKFYNVIIF